MKKNLLSVFSLVVMLFLLTACGTKSYTVTFDVNGGNEEMKAIKVDSGLLLNIPEEPEKDDFVFDYWLNKETNEKWNFGKDKVGKNITLVAQWKEPLEKTYSVRFYTLSETENPATQTIKENNKAAKPDDPERTGYRFLGWFVAEENEVYDFNLPVTSDLIISARWELIEYVTIKFDLNGGIPEIDDVVTERGLKINEPAIPTKDNYNFLGWHIGDDLFDFSSEIDNNITLVARWELIVIYYEVEFVNEFAEEVVKLNVEAGKLLSLPAEPVKSGYKFLGWHLDDLPFNEATPITKDLKLIAVWQQEHTVTFYLDSELTEVYEVVSILDGELVEKPIDPEKLNFKFNGWYIDLVLYEFDEPVKANLTIIASFTEEFVVKFYLESDDVSSYKEFLVLDGNTLEAFLNPTKDLFVFVGWYIGEVEFLFTSPITSNQVITALWEEEPYQVRAYIGEEEYQTISLAIAAAQEGDTILIAEGIRDMDFHVNVNNLTFRPKEDSEVIITGSITLEVGLNGVTFTGLTFKDTASIHASGQIDNFLFSENDVVDLTMESGQYYPANRYDVPAFIRLYSGAGSNNVGNVTVTNNNFSNIKTVIINMDRTTNGKEIILTNNTFYNIEASAIRFDGGYNGGTYTIEGNTFENDLEVSNTSVITFRAYSAASGNTQTINIKDNLFVNMGSTEYPISDTHPGSGVITFSTYNEFMTNITISGNTFTNAANAVHFRNNRGNHTNLSFTLEHNTFIDGTGFILYESHYREADTSIVLGENTYIILDEEVTLEEVSERFIRGVE